MKTPFLLDVPKTHPSVKDRLRAFKEKHGIETWHTPGIEAPWLACLMPRARQFGYGVTEKSDLWDCISKVGRLLDEAGVCAYGDTEREVVRDLSINNGIVFDVS